MTIIMIEIKLKDQNRDDHMYFRTYNKTIYIYILIYVDKTRIHMSNCESSLK